MMILSFRPLPPPTPPAPRRIQSGTRTVPSLNSSLIYCFFLWNRYTRREGSNIFASGAAKWAPALKIVEYPEVMGPCFVILSLFASKGITVNVNAKAY